MHPVHIEIERLPARRSSCVGFKVKIVDEYYWYTSDTSVSDEEARELIRRKYETE